MPQPESDIQIELDLKDQIGAGSGLRRGKPIPHEAPPLLPKIEPVMKESDLGTDETERTVGVFLLISAFPGVVSALFSHGAGSLLTVAIPIYLGIGLIRGDDFARQWVFAACLAQLVLGPVSIMILSNSRLYTLGSIMQNLGLLILVSEKPIPKNIFRICLASVIAGTLMGIIGIYIH